MPLLTIRSALKDGAGKSHAPSLECFRLRHMGVCPKCRWVVPAETGCKRCEVKSENLRYENIRFPEKLQPKAPEQINRFKDKQYSPFVQKREGPNI